MGGGGKCWGDTQRNSKPPGCLKEAVRASTPVFLQPCSQPLTLSLTEPSMDPASKGKMSLKPSLLLTKLTQKGSIDHMMAHLCID